MANTVLEFHVPAQIDDIEMHNWHFEFLFDDGTHDYYSNYGTAREMINWVTDDMEYRNFIMRTHIWVDCQWWGEVERR